MSTDVEIEHARQNLDSAIGRELGYAFVVIGQSLPLTAAIEDLIRAYLVNPPVSVTPELTQPENR